MRKLFFILFSIILIHSRGQIPAQNLAVRKPLQIDSISFNYTGAIQKFIVPNKVTSIKVQAIGAKGGTGGGGQTGGAGANITTTLNVTPGQVLYIVVGGFPGQSATPKYGFGGYGGIANSSSGYGGAGGGLSGVFSTSTPSVASALLVAGGGGGGSGTGGSSGYTGGAALNTSSGSAANGAGSIGYPISTRYQFGYGASLTGPGVGGYAYDNAPAQNGGDGNDINGGAGGPGTGWQGAGGGGAGYYGGGGGAGGGAANGGGGGGSTKSSSSFSSFGTANISGDGMVFITCFSNSGLVLHLDAGNNSSYNGSGTTWHDLSGNGSNVTLSNTTYNSSNGGSIVFNGTSSYADFNAAIGGTNVVTVEMWVKTNSLTSPTGMYFGFNLYDVWSYGGNIGYNTSAGDQYGVTSSQIDYLGVVGNWRHLVFVMYAGSNTSNKIYINAESQTMTQIVGTFGNATSTFYSGNGRISGWRYDGSWKMNMQLASFKIYNRELTSQEIRNNFNAQSSRFYSERDGLSPNTASTSAYQIKQDYPNSTDGFYWIKNANINGGKPTKIYADMTTDGGGWTLILKNSTNAGWTYANAISLNSQIPFVTNADVTNTATSNYSIINWADYLKKSATGFQYMIDANTRGSYGGIWTANGAYIFTKGDNTQTDITLNTKFGTWNYVTNQNGIQKVMPWYSSTAGGGYALLTLTNPTGNWWGTLISAAGGGYNPAPWISDGNGGAAIQQPGIIWYWVR
jgi:hypothetical protein